MRRRLLPRVAVEGRATAKHANRRNATIYSLSGLLRCAHCREKMRVVRTEKGRVRYHCRSKAQRLGCSGKGSLLDVYEEQVIADLAAFTLPEDWREQLLAQTQGEQENGASRERDRRRLEARLARLRELYTWGDIARDEYQIERDSAERELAQLVPVAAEHDRLRAFARYLESLPAAWTDATSEQRNRLVNLIYEDICVDGPAVAHVKPRPELEPLFQVRTGASQPVERCVSHPYVGSGDPDGERGRMIQQLDFPVDEPVSLPEWRRHRLGEQLPSIAARIERGETLRTIAAEQGVSHESLRQALRRAGTATLPTGGPTVPLRRVRMHRVPGRGRSTALAPDEVAVVLMRRQTGESIRSLARTTGVSHETIRRVLARATQSLIQTATA